MRPTARKTDGPGLRSRVTANSPHLYELGIPVVETDIRWHVSVGQKVPLNSGQGQRDPGLRCASSCTAVAEAMRESLNKDDAGGMGQRRPGRQEGVAPRWSASSWTRGSARFALPMTPAIAEANIAGQVKHGGTIVHGGMLTRDQWENVKEKGAIEPAGKVWPTPKPYSDDPDAPRRSSWIGRTGRPAWSSSTTTCAGWRRNCSASWT